MSKSIAKRRTAGPTRHNAPLRAVLLAFAGGLAVAAALLALFAALLTAAPIPLSAARPMACLGLAAGAAVSGWLLANGIGRAMLLCGLGSGVFYAACDLLAGVLLQGSLTPQQGNAPLLAALLLGGLLGGSLAAVRGKR